MFTRLNPSRLLLFLGLAAIATGVLGSATSTYAQASYTILHTFTGGAADGAGPAASLIQGPDGTLYGTTGGGGPSNRGTVFQMAPDGSGFTILHNFTGGAADGAGPAAGLIQGPDGTLYGTTSRGGPSDAGTVFQMAPDGSGFTILHSFTGFGGDGQSPAGLIQGPDGTLYGTTATGGVSSNSGTVFQMAPDGSGFTILHTFTGADGQDPEAGLIWGLDGTLYGTTRDGGGGDPDARGTVFQMAPDGSGFTLLHSFARDATDGANPGAGLLQGPDGTLYGTTANGGSSDAGTVFQIAPDGSGFALLHSFTGGPTDGAVPFAGLIQDPDGTLYGTTAVGGSMLVPGTVFQMAPDGSGFALLHSFTGTDGLQPRAGLIQASDGTLYGTTFSGGARGVGVVFQLTLSPTAPTRR